VLIAASVVLIPGLPLGFITALVQAMAGILLPSATIFLVLLCNDHAVLGPRVNPRWLNAGATTVDGVLLVLSAMLTLTTLFSDLPVMATSLALSGALVVALIIMAAVTARGPKRVPRQTGDATWTMPPLDSLEPPQVSRARTLGLAVLRCYLLVAVVALIVKAVRVALGS
jgi:hypothetical protein